MCFYKKIMFQKISKLFLINFVDKINAVFKQCAKDKHVCYRPKFYKQHFFVNKKYFFCATNKQKCNIFMQSRVNIKKHFVIFLTFYSLLKFLKNLTFCDAHVYRTSWKLVFWSTDKLFVYSNKKIDSFIGSGGIIKNSFDILWNIIFCKSP
jgi:hypothetical protein